jgi:hypothetical protein
LHVIGLLNASDGISAHFTLFAQLTFTTQPFAPPSPVVMADVILRDAYHFSEIARGCSKVEVFDGGGCAAFLSEVLFINPKQWDAAITLLQSVIPSCTELMLEQFSDFNKELPEDAIKLLRQKLTKATTENFTCEGLKVMKVLLHEAQYDRWRGLTIGSRASKLAFNLKERNAIWQPPNDRHVQVAVMSASADAVDLQTFNLILTDEAHAVRLKDACESILVDLKEQLKSLASGTSAIAIAVVEKGALAVEKSSVTAAKATEIVAATAAAKVADKAATTSAKASVAAAKAMETAATAATAANALANEVSPQRPPASTPINDSQLRRRLAQLQAEGWQAMDVAGDGNCFFRALAKQVFPFDERLHGSVRQATIQYMIEHYEDFELTDSDFGLYIVRMSSEGTYIEGETEIRAAANALNSRIWVVGRSNDHDKMFAPLISNLETRDVYMAHFQAAQHYVVLEQMVPSPNPSPFADLPQMQRPSTPVAVFTIEEEEADSALRLRQEPQPASKIKRKRSNGNGSSMGTSTTATAAMNPRAEQEGTTQERLVHGGHVCMGKTALLTDRTYSCSKAPIAPMGRLLTRSPPLTLVQLCKRFGQLQPVRATETLHSSHRPHGKIANALASTLACQAEITRMVTRMFAT